MATTHSIAGSRQPSIPGAQLPASPFEMTIIGFLIVLALYFGQVVLMPLALAVILSLVLAPPVRILRRFGLSNSPAVFLVVAVAFAAIFGIGALITQQVGELVSELPRYQATLRDKVKSLKVVAEGSSGTLRKASETLRDLQQELEAPDPGAATSVPVTVSPLRGPLGGGGAAPVPVEVRSKSATPLDQLQSIVAVIIAPLATAGIVVLFVLFLLLQREDVRDRAIRLLGSGDLERSTSAMDDAVERLSRYFLTLTAINIAFGGFIALGLWLIGVPSPLLWGVLATLMRFVPFLGSFLAAICPLLLSAAVDPGWSMFLMTLALYAVSEPLMGNVIEPVLQGQSTGLSPLAIVISAAFWTLLWGPIGLLLAIPLTVVLVVLGHHVERLEFLNVLLGDAPPLSPAQRFYQRMLAGDPAEAVEQAERVTKEKPLVDYYDEVVIEGLRLAQADADRDSLDPQRLIDIRDTAETVIDTLADFDLAARKPPKAAKTNGEDDEKALDRGGDEEAEAAVAEPMDICAVGGGPLDAAWRVPGAVLAVASRTALDETAAMAFAQLAGKCGLGVKVLDLDAVRHGNLPPEEAAAARLIAISALDVRERSAHARFLVRRLKRAAPQALLLGCFWKLDPETERDKSILDSVPVDATAHSLREAVTFALQAASTPADEEQTGAARRRQVLSAAS